MKINIRKQSAQKKYPHNLSHDVSTTSDFGFVQPILGREISPDDNVTLRTACITRLAPMVKPTFGRVMVRQYNVYVPYEDIYHPFGSLLAGKSYRGSGPSYIPTSVPNLSERYFRLMVGCFGTVGLFSGMLLDDNNRVTGIGSQLTRVSPSTDLHEVVLSDYFSHFTLPGNVDSMFGYYLLMQNYGYLRFNESIPTTGIVELNPGEFDLYDTWVYDGVGYLIGFKLSRRGRNLRKVHLGVGNQLSSANKAFSLMPMFCYFKAWFDLFQPARDKTWKDTLLHSMLETIEQDNLSMESYISRNDESMETWIEILAGISDCYYTQNPDYISAHVVGQSVPQSTADVRKSYLDENGEVASLGTSSNSVMPYYEPPTSGITQNALDILRSLTTLRNISTVVGGRIKEFLRSIYGSEYRDEKDSFFLGSNVFDVTISDIMSTAETSEGYLGEYAGRGIGGNEGKHMKFNSPAVGCLLTMFAVVPDAQFCQGVDPLNYHISKDDFFNALVDAKTLIPSSKTILFGAHDIFNLEGGSVYGRDWTSGSFGNIPNYSEYCQAKNVLNGDMSLMSTRESYLPFNIDKLLPFDNIFVSHNGDGSFAVRLDTSVKPDIVTAGSLWRFIGRYRWLGNFDRIFVNSGREDLVYSDGIEDFFPIDDNFILHFYVDLKLVGYKLPMSSSFDTGAFGANMSVEKA